MALMIPDAAGIYTEAEPPLAYDPVLEAYRDTEGYVYNPALDAWKKVWPERPEILYLYKSGDECMDVTGGWSGKASKHVTDSETPTVPEVTRNGDNIYFTVPGSGQRSGGLYTVDPVDLTKYEKLVAVISGVVDNNSSALGSLELRDDPDAYFNWDHSVTVISGYRGTPILSADKKIFEMDIKEYTGLWYPGLYIANTMSGKVSYMQLWELYLM